MTNKKRIFIASTILILIIPVAVILVKTLTHQEEIEISKANFPEKLVREVAKKADKNNNGFLSLKEAGSVKMLYFKKLQSSALADVLEVTNLPSYTNADFSFDFKGIEHFYNVRKLTVDLADGEFFNKESTEKQIYVKTANLEKIYELKNLKSLIMYEVELEAIDISKFPNLERLNIHDMYNMNDLILNKHQHLDYLWISNNEKLESIDLTKIPSLKQVYIRDNSNLQTINFGEENTKVEEFNIMNLPRLTAINLSFLKNLKTLYLRNIPIKELDISNNLKLDRAGFFNLKLDTLDLTPNKKLTYLINDSDSFKNIIIPTDNIISWLRWTNSKQTKLSLSNLNPKTLIGLDIQGTSVKELDITDFSNLENLYYDKELTTIIGDTSHIKRIGD